MYLTNVILIVTAKWWWWLNHKGNWLGKFEPARSGLMCRCIRSNCPSEILSPHMANYVQTNSDSNHMWHTVNWDLLWDFSASSARRLTPIRGLLALAIGISQSWDRLKANLDRTRSSHLICTQPGLRRKDQGWYHFSMMPSQEHRHSSQRWSTCSL